MPRPGSTTSIGSATQRAVGRGATDGRHRACLLPWVLQGREAEQSASGLRLRRTAPSSCCTSLSGGVAGAHPPAQRRGSPLDARGGSRALGYGTRTRGRRHDGSREPLGQRARPVVHLVAALYDPPSLAQRGVDVDAGLVFRFARGICGPLSIHPRGIPPGTDGVSQSEESSTDYTHCMSTVGRNQPCPCGSGKKYKRCCLGHDDAGADLVRARRLHDLDERVVQHVLQWAGGQAPDAQEEAFAACPVARGDDSFEWVGVSALVALTPTRDGTLLSQYRAARSAHLAADEAAWIDALEAAWVGLWEVLATKPGRSLNVRDLLTGAEREVLDASLSESATVGRVLCARIVEYDGLTLATCVHPHGLSAVQAQRVVTAARADEAPLAPEALRGAAGAPVLRAWHDAGTAARDAPLPRLVTKDGETLQDTADSMRFAPEDRAAVINALAGMRDTEAPPNPDAPEVEFVVLRSGSQSILGSITVGEIVLTIQTMSEADGDTLLGRVTSALGSMARHTGRGRLDMQDAMASSIGRELPDMGGLIESGPEIDALLREVKTEQYATWPDESIPALGGRTPREAVQDPEGRREVETILREIDAIEARYPKSQRYDADILRRALGLK